MVAFMRSSLALAIMASSVGKRYVKDYVPSGMNSHLNANESS